MGKQYAGAADAAAKTAEEQPAPAEEAASQALPTVDELADLAFPADKKGRRPSNYWQHGAASALHGWNDHAHHAGAPMAMSAQAYYAALVAASAPDGRGNYVPHAAALSKHNPHARARTEG